MEGCKGVLYQFIDPDVEEPTPFELHDKLKHLEQQIDHIAKKGLTRQSSERAKARR